MNRRLLPISLAIAGFMSSCTHSSVQPDRRTPSSDALAATIERHDNSLDQIGCDEPPCTDPSSGAQPAGASTHAHWMTGLRNGNITNFGLADMNPPTKVIALTFDDGPGDGTRRILELLDQYGIEAAYFHIGENVKQHPRLFSMIHGKRNADGSVRHIIGNHSYTHPDLASGVYLKDNEALYRQLAMTDSEIKRSMGEADFLNQSNGVIYFRAPYGSWKPADARLMRKKIAQYHSDVVEDLKHYYGPVYWDIGGGISCANPKRNVGPETDPCAGQPLQDAADWECWDRHVKVDRCAEGYYNRAIATGGGVVLSHEIYKNTAKMWEILLPKLKAAGFTFVRLDKISNINRVKLPKALKNDS